MRFDWYQATIWDNHANAIQTIAKLGHELRPCDGLAKQYRYRQGWNVLHKDQGSVATIMLGGNGGNVHAYASSDATDKFVDLMRTEYEGRHLVSRMDPSEDFTEAGSFSKLRRTCRRIAREHRLGFQYIEDKLHPEAGRTQYIGSKGSDHFGRLYEKGYEQLAKQKGLQPDLKTITNTLTGEMLNPADWVRLELQVRPQGEEARRKASEATPEQAWGFTSWTHALAREALTIDLERMYIRTKKTSKDEEAMRWMCKQYGGMLTRIQSDLGDWSAVGLEIGRIIKEQHRV